MNLSLRFEFLSVNQIVYFWNSLDVALIIGTTFLKPDFYLKFTELFKMRQLKGKVNENRKQKKERREENLQMQKQAMSIGLPIIGVIFLFIVVYVYIKSRPQIRIEV